MIRVLYVDDEQSLLDLGQLFLVKSGDFTVDTLNSARQTLEKLQTTRYDAIVSDYQMPEMDGITLLKEVRRLFPALPFILFTGKGREEVVIEAINNGADFYLQKGGDPKSQFAELAHKIRQAVQWREANEALKETEQRLSDIINFLPDATLAIDMEGKVIAWNLAMEEMTGVRREDILGQGDHAYSVPFYGDRRPILIDLVFKSDEEVTGLYYSVIKKEGNTLIAETSLPRPLGVRKVLLGKASLLYNQKGDVCGAIESIRDITAQKDTMNALKESEGHLRESEGKIRAIFDSTFQFTGMLTPEGILLEANRAAMGFIGEDLEDVINLPFWETPWWLGNAVRVHQLQEAISLAAKGKFVRYEVELQGTDNSLLPVDFSLKPVFDKEGHVRLLIAEARDISERKIMEQALKESEVKFREFFNNAGDAIAIHDMQGRFLEVNDIICRRLGYSRDELLEMNAGDVDEPEFGKQVGDHIGELERVGHIVFETVHRAKDGTRIPTEVSSRIILYNRRPAVISTARNISRRRRVEEEARAANDQLVASSEELKAQFDELVKSEQRTRESEERFRSLFENALDMIQITGPDGSFLHVNPAWKRILGYTDEEVRKMSVFDIIHPESLTDCIPIFRELVSSSGAKVIEVKFLTKEGKTIIAEGNCSPELHDGTVVSVRGIFRDITERKRVEDELRASDTRYKNIVEDQTEYICRFLPDGTHIFVNEAYCRVFNKTRDEITGHRFVPDIPKEDRDSIREHFRSLTPKNPVALNAHRIRLPDGSVRWHRWSDRAIFDSSGNIVEYQSVGRDITEQKQVEEKLRHVNRQLNLLSSITRHDILNQLTVLKGYLELSRDFLDNPKILSEYLERELIAANTIQDHILFTRDYQKMGMQDPVWQNVNTTIQTARAGLHLRDITVEVDRTGPEIFADPLFDKVLYNLIENALRYGGNQLSTIRVSSQESGKGLILVCEDDGVGITEEDKKKIFQRGFGRHTGLGLFLSREILGITGITITETGEPGKGARFEIAVPEGAWRFS